MRAGWHLPPAELYDLIEHSPGTVLLEAASAVHAGTLPSTPPRTRLFADPLRICVAQRAGELAGLFADIESATAAGLYAAGYFSYECGAVFEPTASSAIGRSGSNTPEQAPQPLAWFGIYERPFLFDPFTGRFDREPPSISHFNREPSPTAKQPEPTVDCMFSVTEAEYTERIAAIHDWIRAGDIYQLNFTWPIQVRTSGSQALLYRRLRQRQAVPYGAFLHTATGRRILSFSPELFFHLDDEGGTRRIITRPMKGTAPRGRTTHEDSAFAEWLRNDPKNRSENVMIVDLLRNDLGRLCAFGSVRASDLFAVERYPTLWQMTSTVSGELRPEVTFQQIFRALFPCGSVTGAPKIRAMQLLSEIEQQPRGVYSGAIGFFSKKETTFNVAIRTLALDGDAPSQSGVFGIGSGIVIDSNASEEFRECLLKAQFLTGSACGKGDSQPDGFSLVETLLWRGKYPLIDLHLDRLEDSAHYFGFPFDRNEVGTALASAGGKVPAGAPHKMRLLLDSDGQHTITHEALDSAATQLLRVTIAEQRTDPQDPMYFHKTTYRPVYAKAFEAAARAGYDDVLFLNLRAEVTESSIHNIFVEKNGMLLTPLIECGVLAGVQRRRILATHSNAREQILTLDDLRQADAIYLCNAVRGLRRAIIDWEA
jgi:para-aminobenzoate synthetase/4-amino-4-deoxychorismate lyase